MVHFLSSVGRWSCFYFEVWIRSRKQRVLNRQAQSFIFPLRPHHKESDQKAKNHIFLNYSMQFLILMVIESLLDGFSGSLTNPRLFTRVAYQFSKKWLVASRHFEISRVTNSILNIFHQFWTLFFHFRTFACPYGLFCVAFLSILKTCLPIFVVRL